MISYIALIMVPFLIYMALLDKRFAAALPRKTVIHSFFAIFLFMLIFRDTSVGIDLVQNKRHFLNYSTTDVLTIIAKAREIGYPLLCRLIGLLTGNFRWIIIACAVISVVPIWVLYKKESDDYLLSLLLFANIGVFAMYFSAMRQVIAMSFMMPCYYFCKNKKAIPFLLTIAVAYLFHQSALVMLALYPLFHLKIRNKWYLLLLIPLIGVCWYFSGPIMMLALQLLGGIYAERYGTTQATGAYAILLLLILLLVYSFVIPDKKKLTREIIGLRNVLILSVFIQAFAGVHTLVMRVNYYFLLLIPITIPKIMSIADARYKQVVKLSKMVMILFFMFYFIYHMYTDADALHIYPYIYMWD